MTTTAFPGHFGKGWTRDFDHQKVYGIERLITTTVPVPKEINYESFYKQKNQLQTSSCVGNSLGQSLNMKLAIIGKPTDDFSEKGIYDFARMMDKKTPTEPLLDEGCQPYQAMRGLTRWGVPKKKDWPFSVKDINVEPPLDIIERGSGFLVTGYYKITQIGSSRLDAIDQALAQKHVISWGTDVDRAFEEMRAGQIAHRPSTDTLGGHMMGTCGRRQLDTGKRIYRNFNSWGDWCDAGLYWADEGFMTDGRLGDIYVITIDEKGH